MTEKLFSSVLEIGLAAGLFIVLVAALRGLFRRAPHRVFVLLWLIAGLRLLVPVNIESPVSVRGFAEQWQAEHGNLPGAIRNVLGSLTDDGVSAGAAIPSLEDRGQDSAMGPSMAQKELTAAGNAAGEKAPGTVSGEEKPKAGAALLPAEPVGAAPEEAGAKTRFAWHFAAVVWLCGAGLLLAYGVVRYLWLRFRLRDAVRYEGNVWQSDRIDTPFLFGVIRPRIYVPFGIKEKLPYVLAHERTHLRHGDHIVKALWFVVLALYWFHPLVWLAYGLLGRDMELACDERVILGLNDQEKSGYARALLELSMGKKPLVLSPLAFGEVGVKARIIHMLSYKKPAIFGALVCLLIGGIFAAVLLTDPKSSNAQQDPGSGGEQGAGYGNSQDKEASGDKVSGNMENSDEQGDAAIGGATVALGDKTVGVLSFGGTYRIDLDGDGHEEQVFATLAADGYLAIKLTLESGEVQTGVFTVDDYDEVMEDKLDAGEVDIGHAVSLWDGCVINPAGDQFYLLDVDKGDSFLELAFLEYGPSDDWETRLVRLENGRLQYIGSFTDSPEGRGTEIAGDGVIKASTRFDLIQTSWVLATWRLVNGRLEYEEPLEGEFLHAEEQYRSDMPVVAARDFTAWLQDKTGPATVQVPMGTKLCIQGFRRIGSHAEDNVDQNSYDINFYYMDEQGDRIEASVFLSSPFGRTYMVNESVDSPMELFDGLNMAG